MTGDAELEPVPGAAKKREAWRRRQETNFAILHTLEELSAPAFCWPREPLAIGIFWDLWQLLDGEYAVEEIRNFLRWYCGSANYLEAVAAGRVRIALDGTPTAPPTEEHRADARQRLAARAVATAASGRQPITRKSGVGRSEYVESTTGASIHGGAAHGG